MLTPKSEESRDFFAKLLGWTYVELPNGGHRMQVNGHDIGGIFDLDGPNALPGAPPHINVMVKVDDADATVEKVKSLGGDAPPAFDVMRLGRMAMCFDPNGGSFDLWQPMTMQGMDANSEDHGAPSWFEAMTSDDERAIAFYTALFGWTPERRPMEGFTYTVFKMGEDWVSGLMPILPDMGDMKPFWGTYFTVNDPDETARLAVQLGGELCIPCSDIPNVGRFGGLKSPQGVGFCIIKYVCASISVA